MQQIIIDEEFKRLIPPLDEKTYKALEENILRNGCMYALVLWKVTAMADQAMSHKIMRYVVWVIEIAAREFFGGDKTVAYDALKNSDVSRYMTFPRHSHYHGL